MNIHKLNAEAFQLNLKVKILPEDMAYPVNMILCVSVSSNEFSALTTMEISIKAFTAFARELYALYETLSGTARLQEPYGFHNFIEFQAGTKGHIQVAGVLHSGGPQQQVLSFQNEFDQTDLSCFATDLFSEYCNA